MQRALKISMHLDTIVSEAQQIVNNALESLIEVEHKRQKENEYDNTHYTSDQTCGMESP